MRPGEGAGEPDRTDPWTALRATTRARIGLGRVGSALPTRRVLELAAAHAAARDAVQEPLDVEAFMATVGTLGLGPAVHVRSRASSRSEYLRRPDLGRAPAELAPLVPGDHDLAIVLADGLSPRALAEHGAGMLAALVAAFGDGHDLAPPVVATQARVALGDHVGAALGVTTVVVVIGERPGLSVSDSLGLYLTHEPRPGRSDADRNCISNVHPPGGLGYAAAARTAAALVAGARELGASGVRLKDSGLPVLGAASPD